MLREVSSEPVLSTSELVRFMADMKRTMHKHPSHCTGFRSNNSRFQLWYHRRHKRQPKLKRKPTPEIRLQISALGLCSAHSPGYGCATAFMPYKGLHHSPAPSELL